MKSRTLTCIIAIALFAALAIPVQLAAQHTRYKLIDLGTFGGPASRLTDPGDGPGFQVLNNRGMLAGSADTDKTDPLCGPGCFLAHAFRWDRGALTDLGTLPDGNFSGAGSINARGWVAGVSTIGDTDPLQGGRVGHAVLWKGNAITDLGTLPGGIESGALQVKDGGQVVGFATINTIPDPFTSGMGSPFAATTRAFIWQDGQMRDIGTLGGPDALPAATCNNERSGLVAGVSLVDSNPNPDTGIPTVHPFLWDNGKMTDLGTLGGTLVGPIECANNRGQVTGQMGLAGNSVFHAFLWDHGVMHDLGTLGGDNSTALWLNNAGEVVGEADLPSTDPDIHHAFLWRNGVMTDLGTFGSTSHAIAINSEGQVVGRSKLGAPDTELQHAFLWENGGPMIDLNTLIPPNSSLELYDAENINDRGEIAGRGLPPGCDDKDVCGHAFLLIPCDSDASCENKADVTSAAIQQPAALINKPSTRSTQTKLTPMQVLNAWRTQVAQRYPGLAHKDW
jgi:probable HAF family extracellular repeat protein